MCIAILNKAGNRLTKETLNNCYKSNRDGMGLMYSDGEKLNVYKTMNFSEFVTEYNRVRDMYDDKDIVLHFRLATHGNIDLDNTHPFYDESTDIGLVHNGIISFCADDSYIGISLRCRDSKSDTAKFYDILRGLPKVEGSHSWILNNESIISLINEAIGERNKLILMDKEGNTRIVNEHMGIWDSDNWYSNYDYIGYDVWYRNVGTNYKYSNALYDYDDYISLKNDKSNKFGYEEEIDDYSILYEKCAFCDKIFSEDELIYLEEYNDIVCNNCYKLLGEYD